ncbi:MAG TPA: hypothetical protein VGK25_04555 [Ignavibacteria bacterium]|jgi:hypothetical protein
MEKNFFGPFFRATKDDKWHWIRSCPNFPHIPEPQTMISSNYPESSKLCKKCVEIEIINSKGALVDPGK